MNKAYLPVLALTPLPVLLFPVLLRWLQGQAVIGEVSGSYSIILMLGVGVFVALGATLAIYLPYHLESRGVVLVIKIYSVVLVVLLVLALLPLMLPVFFEFITRFIDLHLYRPWLMGLFAFYATLRGYAVQALRPNASWEGIRSDEGRTQVDR